MFCGGSALEFNNDEAAISEVLVRSMEEKSPKIRGFLLPGGDKDAKPGNLGGKSFGFDREIGEEKLSLEGDASGGAALDG
jgi:hypothetical protein